MDGTSTSGNIILVDEYALQYDATTLWQRFVFAFATLNQAETRFGDTWQVQSEAYWSVEAVIRFLLLTGAIVGNLYYWRMGPDAVAKAASNEIVTSKKEENGQDDDTVETAESRTSDTSSESNYVRDKPSRIDGVAGVSTLRSRSGRICPVVPVVDMGVVVAPESAPAVAPIKTKERLHYLDHAKILLVLLVILQHNAEIQVEVYRREEAKPNVFNGKMPLTLFLTLNCSYFMQFFFFISAYFVPSSFESKGLSWFLRDKLRRLGLPLLAVTGVIMPLQSSIVHMIRKEPVRYAIEFGVTWFLFWLMLLTLGYVGIQIWCHSHSRTSDNLKRTIVPLPTLTTHLSFGLSLGLLQGAIAYAQSGNWAQWGFLRLQWAYAPSFVCFFAFGVLAKKNDWLRELQNRSWVETLTHVGVSATAAAALVTVVLFRGKWSMPAMCLVWGVASAMMNVSFPVVILKALKTYCNISNQWTEFLSRAAYAVYLFHIQFLLVLSLIWYAILYVALGWNVLDPAFAMTDDNEWVIAASAVFVTVVGVPVTWSTCWYICRVPGLCNIL